MITDANKLQSGAVLEHDVCIVGAGAAGLTVAHELQQSNLSVCILEAGSRGVDWASQKFYQGEISGDLQSKDLASYMVGSRLRCLGGSTNHWTGWCRPLDAIDFEKRDWIPHSGWPYSREVLEPYYQRAADITGIVDVISNESKYQPAGELLFGGPGALLQSTVFHLSSRVLRSNDPALMFREKYGNSLQSAENTRLVLQANVIELESNESASLVTRVRAVSRSGKSFFVKSKLVVLASGGIENARTLLLSNSVNRAGLGNEHDVVGRFFMEHPITEGAARILYNGRAPRLPAYLRYHDNAINQDCVVALTIPEAVQRAERIPAVNIELRYGDSKRPHNVLTQSIEKLSQTIDSFPATGQNALSSQAEKRTAGEKSVVIPIQLRIEQVPNPDSRVRLAHSTDEQGLQRAHLEWRITEHERALYKRTLEMLAIEFARKGWGRTQIVTENLGDNGRSIGQYHHMGTTRMHADPKQGVVDAHCRVHSVANLFVAGSSVFTTGGHVGPTFTIVALAVKLADRLKEVLQGQR
jgi:choline dehydrogenase-like flavoprotein